MNGFDPQFDYLEIYGRPTLVVDSSGNIAYATMLLSELFGYVNGDLAGKPLEILIPEIARGEHRRRVSDFMATPGARRSMAGPAVTGRTKDGSPIIVEIGLSVSPDGRHAFACVQEEGNGPVDHLTRHAASAAAFHASDGRVAGTREIREIVQDAVGATNDRMFAKIDMLGERIHEIALTIRDLLGKLDGSEIRFENIENHLGRTDRELETIDKRLLSLEQANWRLAGWTGAMALLGSGAVMFVKEYVLKH